MTIGSRPSENHAVTTFRTMKRTDCWWATLVRPGRADALAAGPFDLKIDATRTAAALGDLCADEAEAAELAPERETLSLL